MHYACINSLIIKPLLVQNLVRTISMIQMISQHRIRNSSPIQTSNWTTNNSVKTSFNCCFPIIRERTTLTIGYRTSTSSRQHTKLKLVHAYESYPTKTPCQVISCTKRNNSSWWYWQSALPVKLSKTPKDPANGTITSCNLSKTRCIKIIIATRA